MRNGWEVQQTFLAERLADSLNPKNAMAKRVKRNPTLSVQDMPCNVICKRERCSKVAEVRSPSLP